MVYSFLDVQATITGPGGSFSIGSGAGNAKEGISIEYTEDKDRMIIGADGSAMHSLIASRGGKVLLRLLKTSPTNELLEQMYNFQTSSSALHGQNVIRVTNVVSGDDYTLTECAFSKFPRNDYAEEAGMLEWDFNCGHVNVILGNTLLGVI